MNPDVMTNATRIATTVTLGLLMTLAPLTQAEVSRAEIFNFVRTVWNVTDKTDSALEELINDAPADVTYDGIPYKDLISFLLKVPDIHAAIGNEDYREAAKVAAEYAAESVFSSALKRVGLSSISAPAYAAYYPIDAALQSFVRSVKSATFDYQVRLYFAARKAGNRHEAILELRGGDLLDATGSVAPQGLVTKDDVGWLYTVGRYTGNNPGVFGYTPSQLYEHARLLYDTQQSRLQIDEVKRDLGNAFRALAHPSAPTIIQQPRAGSYAEGGSFVLSVVASGVAPLRYQWFKDSQILTGAIQSTYTVSGGASGDYAVEITDANGLKARSETKTVSMTPAGVSVALTAPSDGTELSGTVAVLASAARATKVEFYVDDLLRFTDTLAPFSWSWNTELDDNGSRILTAKAYNSSTLLGTSAARTVTINNATVPTCNDAGEPNNSSLSATALSFGAAATTGYICKATDVDWFKVSISTPSILQISLTVPAGLDYDLELYSPDARWIAGSYQEAGINEVIEQLAVTPGTYFFRVYGYPVGRGSFSATAPYQIVATRTDAAADTITSGEINQPATWAGVVELVGDVTIGPGGSLRILPGTQIRSLAGVDQRASGVDANKIEIILNGGSLNVSGTEEAPVLFTSKAQTPQPGQWHGLRVVEGDVVLKNFLVEHATAGLSLEDTDTRFQSYEFANGTVQKCSGVGVSQSASGDRVQPVTLTGFKILNNGGYGVFAVGPMELVDSQVNGNSSYGVYGDSGRELRLTGCEVNFNNGSGVFVSGKALFMERCTVSRNTGSGIYAQSSGNGVAEVRQSLIQGNAQGVRFYYSTVTFTGNTVSDNQNFGVQLYFDGSWGRFSEEGFTGNVIRKNDVGVQFQGGRNEVLALSANDIYQNAALEIRNDSSFAIQTKSTYFGEPTTTEISQNRENLSRIYDNKDGGGGQVLVENQRAAASQIPPAFIIQPQGYTAAPNEIVNLSAYALGLAPISYQWFKDGAAVSRGTNNILTFRATDVNAVGNYFTVAMNVLGNATSVVAQVTLNVPGSPPQISQHPQSATVVAGSTVTFSVVATGTGPFTYQWQKSGVPVAGATGSSLTINNAQSGDAASYSVVVANLSGSTTSQAATLTIAPPAADFVVRTITQSDANFSVSLAVTPPAGSLAYVVEENIPAGFSSEGITGGGLLDSAGSRIVWGPFTGNQPQTLTYALRPPAGFVGTVSVTGRAFSFNTSSPTVGQFRIIVVPSIQGPTLQVSVVSGFARLVIEGEVGKTYRIEANSTLGQSVWETVGVITLDRSPRTFVDPDSIGLPYRFYRAVLVSQ